MSFQARYQETMEQEINRHDNVCQDLSKEVAVRKHESLTLQEKLNAIRGERDELAIENLRLKAQVSFHAKQEAEYSELKRRYLDYEERGIQGAVAAVESRDKVIDDLSMKLERALDQLELEREQQRQRRQIIFPPSPPVGAKKG
jgi:Skp family chaperone for outer membrane proteins